VLGDGFAQQAEMTGNSLRHDDRVLLPAAGRAFDIGEKEGVGAAWEIGHDPFPWVRSVLVLSECRTRIWGSG
jgi:hypothetical protein